MPKKKQVVPMSFVQETSSITTISNSVTVLEDNNMTQINDMTNTAKLNLNNNVWDKRRVWVQPTINPAIKMTKDQILVASPVRILEELLNENRIALTSDANGSRKNGGHVIFDNALQIKQLFKTLALFQYGIHDVALVGRSDTRRDIYLVDPVGDFSRWLVETSDGAKVNYEVFYASVKYNNMGVANITQGKVNPMQQSIHNEVESYNLWATLRNAAVLAKAKGETLDADQIEILKTTQENIDPNKFVQYNTVHLLNEQDVVNKYALESWLLLDETRPAFEIWTNAGTFEKAIARLERKLEQGTRAYRNELASLACVNIWDEAVTE